ncbi:hypothetical protein M5689_006877 [Euphorbia peplus]|nr:hypothetical protein M5689_006877 [Euphorbia peplus]
MFRALSTRRSRVGYERLLSDKDDSCPPILDHHHHHHVSDQITLKRAKTVPAGRPNPLFCTNKVVQAEKPLSLKKKTTEKKVCVHPLFSLFDGRRRKKKTTAKPEFTRYLEYVREGGMWDVKSNMPVIYFK